MARRSTSLVDLDLVRVARWHGRCCVLVLVLLFTFLIPFAVIFSASALTPTAAGVLIAAMWVVQIVSLIAAVVFVVQLQLACGKGTFSVILWAFLTLFLSILTLAASASMAGTILRLAGLRSGFLGFPKREVEKLRPGHCRGCGYSRDSLDLLAPCPECNRVPVVW